MNKHDPRPLLEVFRDRHVNSQGKPIDCFENRGRCADVSDHGRNGKQKAALERCSEGMEVRR